MLLEPKLPDRLRDRILFFAFVCFLCLGVLWFVLTQHFASWDFRNNLWAPAHLLVSGASPYRISVLFENSGAVWFPMAIGLFFPLGFLPEPQAASLWFIVNLFLLLVLIWLANDLVLPSPIRLALILCLVFLFPPVISHLILGQFTILATILLLVAARAVAKPNLFVLGFLLALSLTKPQLVLLALPGIVTALGKTRGVLAAVKLMVVLSLCTALLTAPFWIAYPSWLEDFLMAQRNNPIWLQPSLSTTLAIDFGVDRSLALGLTAVVVFAINIWVWFKLPPQRAILWSLALTPLASPYIWSWDFVLVLPLLAYVLGQIKGKVGVAFVVLGCALCWGWIGRARLIADNSDHVFWWVPYFILLVICGAYLAGRVMSIKSEPRLQQ